MGPLGFDLYVGIDYSGAQTPESPLKALQVYAAGAGGRAEKAVPPLSSGKAGRHWCRHDIACWLAELAGSGKRFIAGIDHCFSLPLSYFNRYGLTSWDGFLADFVRHWPAHAPRTRMEALLKAPPDRMGEPGELRLSERWTQAAKSVFIFHGTGAVGKSSFSGIPWLHWIREQAGENIHFWPFDGWSLPSGKSVLLEVYPALCKRRYPRQGRTSDEQDAFAVATWLQDMHERAALERYCRPPLTEPEKLAAGLEGWIFGVA